MAISKSYQQADPEQTQLVKPKSKRKTKGGCRTCKIRKVKCDEGRPCCHRCQSTGRICEGYGICEHILSAAPRRMCAATSDLTHAYRGRWRCRQPLHGTSADLRRLPVHRTRIQPGQYKPRREALLRVVQMQNDHQATWSLRLRFLGGASHPGQSQRIGSISRSPGCIMCAQANAQHRPVGQSPGRKLAG